MQKNTKRGKVIMSVTVAMLLCLILFGLYQPESTEINQVVENTFTLDDTEEIEEESSPTGVMDTAVDNPVVFEFTNWRSGTYSSSSGKYVEYANRLCLKSYVTFGYKKYKVVISNPSYGMIIRELDDNMNFIRQTNPCSGSYYIPSANARYLGIGIVNIKSSVGVTYNTYQDLFKSGFYARLEPVVASGMVTNMGTVTSVGSTPTGGNTIADKVLEKYPSVDSIDFTNFDNWKGGIYSKSTGTYSAASTKICLKQLVTVLRKTYYVEISDNNFEMMVTELDENEAPLKTGYYSDGKQFQPSSKTKYLAITLYDKVSSAGYTVAKFKTLFEDGLKINITSASIAVDEDTVVGDTIVSMTSYKNVEDIDLNNISSWRSGNYDYQTGKFAAYSTRICLNDYVTFKNTQYTVTINDSNYAMLIRELDSNKKFVKSSVLLNNQTFTPNSGTKYLAIGIYNKTSETGMTFDKYKSMISGGSLKVALNPILAVSISPSYNKVVSTPVKSPVINSGSVSKEPATFRELLKDMLLTGDMSARDVSKYDLSYAIISNTFDDLIKNECYLAYMTTNGVVTKTTKDSDGKIKTISLSGMDSEFMTRYKKIQNVIEEVRLMIDENAMNDVEKALICHDYLITHTSYVAGESSSSYASGSLVYGKAICGGYTNGLMLLLHEFGIQSYFINGNSGSHDWLIARLDGQLYHIDPTWDDKRTARHKNFVCNDTQIKATGHNNWKSYEITANSSSKLYEDWFVHDIGGPMLYYKGLWYYYDTSSKVIKASTIDGKINKVIVNSSSLSGEAEVVSIDGNVLTYKIGTKVYAKTL